MALITVPGMEDRESSNLAQSAWKNRVVSVNQVRTYQIQLARAAGAPPTTVEAADDDIAELELEGGIRFWTSIERLRQEFPISAARGPKSEVFALPPGLPIGSPTRGVVGSWLFKTLRV